MQPTGSVANERRFSAMNNIKTAARNRLGMTCLNASMRMFCSSHADFPFEAAFDCWHAGAEGGTPEGAEPKHRRNI